MRTETKSIIRTIETPHFGVIEIEDRHIFQMKDGMLGFENLKEFVLISEEETAPFKWFISIEDPEIGFPFISPWFLDIDYKPVREFDIDKHVMFVVITLQDKDGNMSANMKAPVILNVEDQSGEQIIIPSDKYSTNFIIESRKKESNFSEGS
jgi:flagellar assembly factor FliW